MASKGSKNVPRTAENDIEKNREEGNWMRVIEIADLMIKAKPALHSFLVGEAKLEAYLEHYPPNKKNSSKAKTALSEAENFLRQAVTEEGDKCGVALDGYLLLAKIQYAISDYDQALKYFDNANLEALTEKHLSLRSLKIIAESFAIKGLCLETKRPSGSKEESSKWVLHVSGCYVTACNLGLLYAQQQDKLSSGLTLNTIASTSGSHSPLFRSHVTMSSVIQSAIQRAPIFLIENGKLVEAISLYRVILSAIEAFGTHDIRLTVCRQLAEILLRKVKTNNYLPPPEVKKQSSSPWTPLRYTGINIFTPRNKLEEVILLLLIGEAMATRSAVLSQSPEFADARVRAYSTASSIYDLLTVVLSRWKKLDLLQEAFERAMKFSNEEAHTWMQEALCLASMGQHFRALLIMKEVTKLLPDKTVPSLVAARIAYQLCKIDDGLSWSEKALKNELAHPENLISRCYLYIGIGYHCKALSSNIKGGREKFIALAAQAFENSHETDPDDHLSKFYLGLLAAIRGRIQDATSHVKGALSCNREHHPSLHLMVLLLTAQKKMSDANHLLKTVLEDYSNNLALHLLNIVLESHINGTERALSVAKEMLVTWKNKTLSRGESPENVPFSRLASEFSERDTTSVRASQALVVSRVEQAQSMVASSFSSSHKYQGLLMDDPQCIWVVQLKIWLTLAELYIDQDQLGAASSCLQEAINIFPTSHQVMYVRGLMHEKKNEFFEAKQCYQNAISIDPHHVKSLQHLGLMCHYLGNQRLAEKTLRFAAKIDPDDPQTWYNLGKVLESIGECENATACLTNAMKTEIVSPLIPFSSIPVTFD